LLDFNHLGETEVSLEALQLGLELAFWALKVGLIDRSIDRILPFLNTYRTMCLAPNPDFLRILEGVGKHQLSA
jgi:hypothetical protein